MSIEYFDYKYDGFLYSNFVGEGLDNTKSGPLVWKTDDESDGTFDSITYFTYDSYRKDIMYEIDDNLDGIIDSTTTNEWLIIV